MNLCCLCVAAWITPLTVASMPPEQGPVGAMPSVTWSVSGPDVQGREYRISAEDSDLCILIYPAGLFAHFGHRHVIGGPVISGTINLADRFSASSLELVIPVADLEVDRPEWLRDEGFPADLSEKAIADTRDNMLSEDVLDAQAHPEIHIRSSGVAGPVSHPDVTVRITLRGVSRDLTVPVELDLEGDQLSASGSFPLLQTDFGIRPFRALAGGLRVADEMLVRFRVVAYAEEQGARD